MLIHHSPNLNHWFDQSLRRENVAQPQGWIEDLAHCASVDDAAGVIETLQTREWGTGVPKLRVVIILKNIGVTGTRKFD